MDETPYNSATCNLDEFRKTALSKRELAWALLKQTRNPQYVAARYGYTVTQMTEALAKLESQENENKKQNSENSTGPGGPS